MSVTPFPAGFHLSEQPWNAAPVSLGDSIRALASSLMSPTDQAPDQSWRAHLRGLLEPLREAFAAHREATEGDRGLYAGVVVDAPRLARTVDGLVAEHTWLDTLMARLAHVANAVDTDAETLRRGAIEVLDELARHRQRDADLVYEAYTTDIGGE